MNDKFVDMPKCMADKYETADFIASDPVQFPRRKSKYGISVVFIKENSG